jgi:phosphate transport system substrate-binding protein
MARPVSRECHARVTGAVPASCNYLRESTLEDTMRSPIRVALTVVLCGSFACKKNADSGGAAQTPGTAPAAAGNAIVRADGSSTVFPIAEAVAEEFQKANRDIKVTVGISGTGGGFKKFCTGETDVSNASRPIKPTEVELCGKNGVEYIELPVAYDGLAVLVNPKNDWA